MDVKHVVTAQVPPSFLMSYSLVNQLRLIGDTVFEEICGQILAAENPTIRHVDGSGGDKGLDLFCGQINPKLRQTTADRLRIWQVKYFATGIRTSQKRKIEESLFQALIHRPDEWTLCVHTTLTPEVHEWLRALFARACAQCPHVKLDYIEGSEWVRRLLKPENKTLRESYFLSPQSDSFPRIVRQLNHFERVSDLLAEGKKVAESGKRPASEFYDCQGVVWADIVQDFDAPRNLMGDLWRFLVETFHRRPARIPVALISGMSGEGKTALLMRTASEFCRHSGWPVLYYKEDRKGLDADSFAEVESPLLLVIDGLGHIDAESLQGFLTRLYRSQRPVAILAAEVDSVWNSVDRPYEEFAEITEFRLTLTEPDVHLLLDKLEEHGQEHLHHLQDLTREEQVRRLLHGSAEQFLVAWIEARSTERFGAHIRNELETLRRAHGDAAVEACAYVSAFHEVDLPMPRRLLESLLAPTGLDSLLAFRTKGLLIELLPERDMIRTRHPLVATAISELQPNPERVLKRIIERADLDDLNLLLSWLDLRSRRKGDESATHLIEQAAAQWPHAYGLSFLRAIVANRQRDYNTAEEWFWKSFEHDPDGGRPLRALASLTRRRGHLGSSEDPEPYTARWLFREATKADPLNGWCWTNWANLERDQSNFGNLPDPKPYTARWLFRKALQSDPESIAAIGAWAIFEKERGNFGDQDNPEDGSARMLYRKVLALAPQDVQALAGLALIERTCGNYGALINPRPETARGLYRRLIAVEPRGIAGLRAWAELEKEQKNLGGLPNPAEGTARDLFARAVVAGPDDGTTYARWALLESDNANIGMELEPHEGTARWLFEKAAHLLPSRETYKNWAFLEKREKNWRKAESLFRAALDLSSNPQHDTVILVQLASIYGQENRRDEAHSLLVRAVECDPESSFAHAQLGRSFASLGDHCQAVDHLRVSLGLSPDNPKAERWLQFSERLCNPLGEAEEGGKSG
jgi:tetratricopeptide (TPR) repeat protein